MQDLKKSADLFETHLGELNNCCFTLAQDSAVAAFSSVDTLTINEYALIHKLNQQIHSHYQSNSFIDNIIIWFEKTESVWINSNFWDSSLVCAADRDYLMDGKPISKFFAWQRTQNASNQLSYIPIQAGSDHMRGLVYTASLYPLSNFRTRAYASILINMRQVEQTLSLPLYSENDGSFHIFGENGEEIYSTLDATAPKSIGIINTNNESIRFKDGFMHFTYRPSGSAYTYQLSLPASYIDIRVMAGLRTSLFVTCFAIVVTAVLAWIFARRNAKPVSRLAKLAYIDPSDRNEFRALNDSISQMLKDNSKMEQSLQNYLDMQKNMIFSKLLSYGYRSEEDVMEALSEAEIMPDAAYYGVASLHFTSPESLKGSSVHIVLTTVFKRLMLRLMHVCPMSSDSYALLYTLESETALGGVTRQFEFALTELKQQYKLIVTIIVSSAASSLMELPILYQATRRAYHAMDISERGRVHLENGQQYQTESAWHLPDLYRNRFISLCQAGDDAMLKSVLCQFFDERILAYSPGKLETQQIAFDFRSLIIQIGQQTAGISLEPVTLPMNTLPNCENAGQLLQESIAIFSVLCEQITSYKENSSHRLYTGIQDYIRAHYDDPNLSLISIADAFNMNDKYLSQFYKKEGHINLTAEIEELRLNRATELMRHSALSLADICTSCGYSSLNSFYKAFKRVYALSPSHYRQNLQSKNSEDK